MAWKVKKIESEWLDPASIVRSHLKVQLLFKPRPLPTPSCLSGCQAASSLVRLALNNNNMNHLQTGNNCFLQPTIPQLHCHIRAVAKPVSTPAAAASHYQCTPADILCRVHNFLFSYALYFASSFLVHTHITFGF